MTNKTTLEIELSDSGIRAYIQTLDTQIVISMDEEANFLGSNSSSVVDYIYDECLHLKSSSLGQEHIGEIIGLTAPKINTDLKAQIIHNEVVSAFRYLENRIKLSL